MGNSKIPCPVCGQDYLEPYRNILNGKEFLLCPECDSAWLPGDDTTRGSGNSLSTIFANHEFRVDEVGWDLIEPVDKNEPA
jgi:transposase-like protein